MNPFCLFLIFCCCCLKEKVSNSLEILSRQIIPNKLALKEHELVEEDSKSGFDRPTMGSVVCLKGDIEVDSSSSEICGSKICLAESTSSSVGNPEVLTFDCNGTSTNKSCSEAVTSPSSRLGNGCIRVEVCFGRGWSCLSVEDGRSGCKCSCCPQFIGKFCDISDSYMTDLCLNGSRCSYEAGTKKHCCVCTDRLLGQRCQDLSPCIISCQKGRSCGVAELTACRCLGFFCVHECPPCGQKSFSRANQNGISNCSQGHRGRLLCEELNDCLKNLCKNGRTCYNAKSSVRCHCKLPRNGQFCQQMDPCLPNPCQHGGRYLPRRTTRSRINESRLKIRVANDFQFKRGEEHGHPCRCEVPYHGNRCQHFDLGQRSNPCLNRGKCESSKDGQLACRCSSRFFGDRCQHLSPCQSGSCPLGTRCHAESPTTFKCVCTDEMCANLADIQLSDEPQCPCHNGGSCVEPRPESSPTFHSRKCICSEGFTGDLCEIKEGLKSCFNQPCLNGGVCKPTPNHSKHPPTRSYQQSSQGQSSPEDYYCHCDSEHQGPFCEEEIPCNDSDKKCYNDGECVKNQLGMFRCNCSEGYSGLKCQSFNPCLLQDTCNHRGKCVVAKTGMYQCLCQVGFRGQHCEIHNPCLDPQICLNNSTCASDIGGDICHCSDGFAGLRCELNLSQCGRVRCESGGKCYDHRGVVDCNCHGESCSTDDKIDIHADHGIINVSFACPAEETLRSRGFYQWPATPVNARASLKCQRNPDQIATRECFNNEDDKPPTWAEPNLSGCARAVKTTSEAVEALLPYTSRDSLDDVTTVNVMELLSDVLEITYSSQEVGNLMLRAIDTILQRSENIETNMTSQLLKLLERYSINCQCLRNGNFSLTLNNLEIYVARHDVRGHDDRQHVHFQIQQNHKLDLSFSTFDSQTSERVAIVIFSTSKLFQGKQWKSKLLGDVVLWASSSAPLARKGKGLVTPATCLVKFSFYSDQPSRNFRCAQWNTSTRMWTGDGVETLTLFDGSISCCSNGFFYLAVVDDEGLALTNHVRSDVIMTIFSLMCFIVSISCHLVITVHFATSRCFNRMEYGQIMLQLSISMVMMDAGLILTYNQRMLRPWTQHFCSPISIFCNFFVTSTHTWFACLAQFTYGQVSSKSLLNERNNIGRRSLVSWGLALIQLLISATLNIYGFVPNSSKCWSEGVNWPALWTTLLIPVILCLCVSTVWCVASAWKSLPCYRFTYERPKYGGHEVGKVVDPEEHFIPEPEAGTKFVIRKTEVFGYLTLNFLFIVSWIAFCLSTVDSLSSRSIVFLKSHCLLRAMSGCLCLSIFLTITCRARRDICCRKSPQAHQVESISSSAASNSTFKQEEVQQHFAAIHSRFHHCAPPVLSSPPHSPTSSHPFPATSMSLLQTPVPSSTTILTSLNLPSNSFVNAPLKLPIKPVPPSLGTFSTLPLKESESVKTYLPSKVVGFAKLSPPPQQSSSSNHELHSCCSLSDRQTLRKKHTRV